MVDRVAVGQSMTTVAVRMGGWRRTMDKWVKRLKAERPTGSRTAQVGRAAPDAHPDSDRADDLPAAALGAAGSQAAGRQGDGVGVNGASGAGRPRPEPTRLDRPVHRAAGTPLREGACTAGEQAHIGVKKVAKVPREGSDRPVNC